MLMPSNIFFPVLPKFNAYDYDALYYLEQYLFYTCYFTQPHTLWVYLDTVYFTKN